MIILFERTLRSNKRLDFSLLECFGISYSTSGRLSAKMGLNSAVKRDTLRVDWFKDLKDFVPFLVSDFFDRKVGFILYNEVIFRLRSIQRSQTLRSMRHSLFLPVRGQRSRKNALTQKRKANRKRIPIASSKKKNKGL